ncbi:MAG: hypothetical protein IJO13_11345 [Lachnospiraceae bacterium]|nr:hypothetical protein [Lachnospiraceae bacterium]
MGYHGNPLNDPDYKMWISTLNEISMYDVIETFDIDRSGDSIICPNPDHHDTRFGNCKIMGNRYHCFACGQGGSNISLIMNLQNKRFSEAAEILAIKMGIPVQRPGRRIKKQEQDLMPVTKSQLEYLGLNSKTSRVFCPEAYDTEKPAEGEFKGDVFGYMIGTRVSFSMEKLYQEDKESFYSVIAGKFKEASNAYLAMYEIKIWESDLFDHDVKPLLQITLERALTELNDLAIRFTENHIMDLSYFKLPEFHKKKKRFTLTI